MERMRSFILVNVYAYPLGKPISGKTRKVGVSDPTGILHIACVASYSEA